MPGWTVTGKRYDLGGSDEAGEEGYPFLKANVSSHNNKSVGLHNPILWFAMFCHFLNPQIFSFFKDIKDMSFDLTAHLRDCRIQTGLFRCAAVLAFLKLKRGGKFKNLDWLVILETPDWSR